LPLAKSRDKEKEGNKLPFGDEKNKTGRKKKQRQKEGE
jgi:hypothetical protein